MTCLSPSVLISPSLRLPTKKAPARGAELRPKSREETPHNGVPPIWACDPPMPIKFEVKRIIAISPASPRVINVLKNSGRLGVPGFQHPTMEIHPPPSEYTPLGGVCVYEPLPGGAFLKYRIAFRRLSRHPRQHDRFLSRYPKIPRCLQRTPDVGIFRAAVESNQLHAMRALHLIAGAQSLRLLAERLATFGALNLYAVGHANSPVKRLSAVFLGTR